MIKPNMADLAGAAVEGQMLASHLIEQLEHECGTGEQLEHAIRNIVGPLAPLASAKLRGFSRAIQKAVERAGVTS